MEFIDLRAMQKEMAIRNGAAGSLSSFEFQEQLEGALLDMRADAPPEQIAPAVPILVAALEFELIGDIAAVSPTFDDGEPIEMLRGADGRWRITWWDQIADQW